VNRMKVRIGKKMGSKQCIGCLKHFPSKRLWTLPYAGSRCTECALRFLNFYKEYATRGILNILNREFQVLKVTAVTKKTPAQESSRCSLDERFSKCSVEGSSRCSSCG
jgi:hypothetical protein